ncbi:MAG: T9SS type A sorting domain-containing protein [Ignavibacteriaceae bacterium]
MNKNIFCFIILIIVTCSIQTIAQEILYNKLTPDNLDKRKKLLEEDSGEIVNSTLHKSLTPYDMKSEVIRDTWDSTQWNEEERTLFTFDEEENLIEEKVQIWNGTSWVNETRILYGYENGNPIFDEHHKWNGTEWLNDWRNVTVYDDYGYSISYSLEGGDSLSWIYLWRNLYYHNAITHYIDSTEFQNWYNSDWKNGYLTKYFYTSDGRDSLIVGYNTPETEWEPDARRTYTYDDATLSYDVLLEQWSGTDWENEAWYSYTYDGIGNLLEEFGRHWEDSDWENWYRNIYNYNSQNQNTESIRQIWNGLGWRTDWRYFYEYNSNNNRTLYRRENYNFGVWVGVWQYLYEYDSNNLLTISTYQDWDGTAWLNDYRERYFYESSTSVEDEVIAKEFHLYNNYPNPFNPTTKISWQSAVSSWQTLKVYDILGNAVAILVDEYKPAGTYEVEFNAEGLSSGIYFYRLNAGSFIETRKMMMIK